MEQAYGNEVIEEEAVSREMCKLTRGLFTIVIN
jgi:hypothetical protein